MGLSPYTYRLTIPSPFISPGPGYADYKQVDITMFAPIQRTLDLADSAISR
jgi:hypothetical protein